MRQRRCTLVLAGCLSAAILFAQQFAPRPERNVLPHADAVGIGLSRDGALSKQFDKRFVHATSRYKFDADEKRRAWMDGRLPVPNPGPALGSW